VFLACIALPAPALAQVPSLDGHRFVPSSLVTWSFVDTQVSSTSECGSTDLVIEPVHPQVPQLSVLDTLDAHFIEVNQSLAGSLALSDNFALSAQLSAGGIVPRDTASSLFIGGHGVTGETVGAALRLVRSDAFQLTLRANLNALEVESIVPALLPSSPRVTGDVLGFEPALAAALALSPRIGFQGSVAANFQRFEVGPEDDVVTPVGALAATVSLDPVPLSVLVGASVLRTYERDVFTPTADAVFGPDRTHWNLEAGLYCTSRRELDLGLLFRTELAGDHDNQLHGWFRLGYYF
jgi:hypothetical protein